MCSSADINLLIAVSRGLNGIAGADDIAWRLGYRPARNGRLAVSAKLRACMRTKLVGRIPPQDQWDRANYFLTPAGKEMLALANQDRADG